MMLARGERSAGVDIISKLFDAGSIDIPGDGVVCSEVVSLDVPGPDASFNNE